MSANIISVMPIKIKSVVNKGRKNNCAIQSRVATPIRDLSRISSGSGLKNLSHQRNIKKLSKLKDSSSENKENACSQIMQSLTHLEEQYQNLKNNTAMRSQLKRSIHIKGVPHTSITLAPRTSMNNQRPNLSLNSTLHSRNNSFSSNLSNLRVVSIGSQCLKARKHPKKKGICISLLQNRSKPIRIC